MAERKRRASERDARRESLLVLLSRTRRGVALTPSEAALMFAHVEVELAEADELRRTVAGQQTAIQREQSRTAAAEAAIVEAEAEAEEHKAEHLAACEQIAAMHAAAVGEVRGPLLGVVEDVASMRAAYEAQHARADTLDRLCREQRQRAEQAEERLAGVERRANIAEGELATLREGIRETGGDPTQVQNVYAQIRMWRNSAQRANHKADRYRLAWTAARRDRKADRAAMAAELPFVKAGRAALDRAGRDRAALLAALTR
jgi:hypothetical protein